MEHVQQTAHLLPVYQALVRAIVTQNPGIETEEAGRRAGVYRMQLLQRERDSRSLKSHLENATPILRRYSDAELRRMVPQPGSIRNQRNMEQFYLSLPKDNPETDIPRIARHLRVVNPSIKTDNAIRQARSLCQRVFELRGQALARSISTSDGRTQMPQPARPLPINQLTIRNVLEAPTLSGLAIHHPPETSVEDVPAISVEEDSECETMEVFKMRLIYTMEQMMFVSGETAEASAETTGMIEEIVRQQVIEMLTQATVLANRRGVRSISTADLIFLIRHDKAKVSRLKSFLSWKDVRKNVKDSDDKGGGDAGDAVDFDEGAALPGAGPADSKKTSSTTKKAKLILPWEVQSFYSEQVPERDDEEDNEEEEEQNEATLARLASADERTKHMTKDEYVFWSDCRQASFTFRKGKRFREWAGFGVVTDSKPNDDIVDILGFLTFEIVQTLTEEALKVKGAEDLHNAKSVGAGESKKRKRGEGSGGLFEMPEEGRTPVEPKHVREAFRRLQVVPNKYRFMRQGYAGVRTGLRLI